MRKVEFWILTFLLIVATLFSCVSQERVREENQSIYRYSSFLSFSIMRDYVSHRDYRMAVETYNNFKGVSASPMKFLYAYSLMKIRKFHSSAQVFESLYFSHFFPDYSLYFTALNYFKAGEFDKSFHYLKLHLSKFPDSIFSKETRCFLTKASLKVNIPIEAEGEFPSTADCLYTKILVEAKNKKKIRKNMILPFLLNFPGSPYEKEILRLSGKNIFTLLNPVQLKQRWKRLLSLRRTSFLIREIKAFRRRTGDSGCYYFFKGLVQFQQRNYSLAIRYFRRARKARKSICHEENFYQLGRSYAREGENKKSLKAFEILLKKFPNSSLKEDVLYRMGLVYSYMEQTSETLRMFKKYYNLFPSGKYRDRLLWYISYFTYKSGNTSEALSYLSELTESTDNMRRAQALYWLSKWDRKKGSYYHDILMNEFPLHYYSYISYRCGGYPPPISGEFDVKFYSSSISFPPLSAKSAQHIYNLKYLVEMGLTSYVFSEAQKAIENAERLPVAYFIGQWLSDRALYNISQKLIIKNFPDSMLLITFNSPVYIDLEKIIYPQAYYSSVLEWSRRYSISPEWIWAVMRQESRFNPVAVSVAGAQGLMQVMRYTAKKMLKIMGGSYYNFNLFDPDENIRVSAFYLKFLFDKFGNQPIPVIVSYNAGEDNVTQWLQKRRFSCWDEFVENIPYDETRRYVKKVISNWMVYDFLKRIPYYEMATR